MTKMKKVLLLALSLAMSATLFAACGKDNGGIIIPDSSTSVDGGSTDTSDSVDDSNSVDDSDGSDDSSSGEPGVTKYTFTKIDGNPRDPNAVLYTGELEAGETLDLTPPAETEGKTFSGWIDVEGNPFEGTTMPEDHLALYATWEITPYTVTIKQDGQEDKVLTFGVQQDINKDIIGLDTIGWNVELALPEATDDTSYAFAEELPETWELKNYEFTIVATTTKYTFTKIDGNPRDPNATIIMEKLEVGAELDLTAPAAVEGKVFKGWVDGEGNVYEGATMPEEHLTLYADWEITPYTVTLKLDGEDYKTFKFGVESDYNDLENQIIGRNELSFVLEGELPAAEGETYYEFAEELPEAWGLQDYTIEIVSKVKTYTFTKIDGNPRMGGAVTQVELKAGDALDLSAPAEVEGKVFNGWVDGEGNVYEGTEMPNEELTLYADWTITPYTVTLKLDGEDYKTLTFGVEDDYTDLENQIIGIKSIGFVIEGEIPEDTRTTVYTVELPEEWALQDYEIEITAEKIDDEDLASSVSLWDRLNATITDATGATKTNKDNYWDGTEKSVTVENQKEVTNGSDFANKLTFDYNRYSEEEKAAGKASYSAWKGEMWVGFKVAANGIDLTNYELVFDMKGENLNTSIIAYAVKNGSDGVDFVMGAHTTFKQADMVDLGDGWYRWTVTVDCKTAAGKAADYIILSLDNAPDTSKETVVYIDNMSLNEVFYYTAKLDVDGVVTEETIRGGSEYTPAIPEKDGYEFTGWVDAEGNEVTTPIAVDGDVALFATWKKLPIALTEYKSVAIDLGQADFDIVSFTGKAGTYKIATGNYLRPVTIVDGQVGEDITEFTLTEDGETYTFGIAYGDDGNEWYTTGSVIVTGVHDELRPYFWRDDKYALTVNSAEPAPAGFTKVSEFNWGNNATLDGNGIPWSQGAKDFPCHIISEQDISAYKDIWFAMKLVEGKSFYVRGGDEYLGTAWLYFHFQQEEGGTWALSLYSADGTYVRENVQTGLVGSNLQVLMRYGGNSGAYPTRDVTNLKTMVYITEVLTDIPPYDPEVSAEATQLSDSAFKTDGATGLVEMETVTEAVPNGFNSVKGYYTEGKTWGSYILNTNDMCGETISAKSELWFAMKIQNGQISETPSYATVDGYNADPWVYFHMTQASDKTWTMEITCNGNVWKTMSNQTGLTFGQLLDTSTDGSRIVIYQNRENLGEPVYIYTTEIMSVDKPLEPFDTQIDAEATVAFDHVWNPYYFTGGGQPEGAYADVTAPEGFSKVSYYNFTDANFPKVGHLNAENLNQFSKVYFAMKAVNARDIYLQGHPDQCYAGTDWLYVYMTKAEDGTWTKSFRSPDGFEWIDGQKNLTGTTLAKLMPWVSGVNTGSYPRAIEGGATTATAYFTEILAVKDPYKPTISADAVKVYDSIWRADDYALSATTDEAAPAGFTMVEEYDWLHNTTMVDDKTGTGNTIPYGSNANDMPLTCLDEADMSNLNEFWFAMKLKGGDGFYVRGSAKYTGGQWLYFHGTRAEDGTWTLELTSQDYFTVTQTGIAKELLKDIILYHAKSETEPWDGGAYPTKTADSETAIVYFTEVYGIQKTVAAE